MSITAVNTTVKVGQVWEDKDKRRAGRRIEVLSIEDTEVHALVVGTENETTLKIARLITRWTLVSEKVEAKVETPQPKFKTREQWLEAAVKELNKIFVKAGFEVPKVRVSVGWPGGRGKKAGVVGQCFARMSAEDNVAQIFVSPSVSDSLRVLATLTHEIVHAVDDCVNGHKGGFIKIAKEIGFLPAWTSSDNRTDELTEKLQKILDKLGPFPHAAIKTEERPVVQKTYMLKVLCTEDPDYFVRMTAGKIEEYGTPLCPCHELAMEVEEK